MRSESEMFSLILGFARNDERIRAVLLNGSRASPSAPEDCYRDYDVVYAVTETAPFLRDRSWLALFGETAIVQEPDSNDFGWGADCDFSCSYAWLMLFTDGIRIDLTIVRADCLVSRWAQDSQTLVLLDKDSLMPPVPPPSDASYLVKKPQKTRYDACCNEFWWCLNNVAKGIARGELPYVMHMYAVYVHTMLENMTEWHIGAENGFSVCAGKFGKYFKKFLSPEDYALYARTYASVVPDQGADCVGDYPETDFSRVWDAVFTACALFARFARSVAVRCGFEYNARDEKNMLGYLQTVRASCSLFKTKPSA